jgi:hypothetical protein
MSTAASSIVIKKILSMSPATGEVKAYTKRTVHGEIVVQKKTSSIVRFSIGDEHFISSTKDFRDRKSGSIFVA